MKRRPVRLAVRAIILEADRLLLVNAYAGRTDLWCAPGGGVDPHASLPENLAREVREESGLAIRVGAPCLVNEFHDPDRDFHQVEIFFRATLFGAAPPGDWTDPEGIVSHRRWVTRTEAEALLLRPQSLVAIAWRDPGAPVYDPLERLLP